MTRMMSLGLLLHPGGQHIAGWRHPEGVPDAGFNLDHLRSIARSAENEKLDFIFVADTSAVRDWPENVVARAAQTTFVLEPLTLMTSLAAVTEHIGFVVTANTTYNQPYTIARQFASLDVLSNGRAAVNVVAGAVENESRNFGFNEIPDHAERYARAAEFVEVLQELWASRGQDLVVADRESGILFDTTEIRPVHHEGHFLSVDGVLNVPPSPQGRPVLVQAGASGPGRELAATYAEVVFAASPVIGAAQEYYSDVKSRMRRLGRPENSARIMPGFIPVIGRTRAEAEAKLAELDALIHPDLSAVVLSELIGFDLSDYPLDGPLPDMSGDPGRSQTMRAMASLMGGAGEVTIRELAAWVAGTLTHVRVVGTAEDIADTMQEWFENGACDGFLINPSLSPAHWHDFADQVLPILRERGLFRRDYEGTTLRENLGLETVHARSGS